MKKTLFIVMAAFITLSAAAQKVTIKKGEIQIDGVSVAKIEKQKKSNDFTFSDLNGTPLFTVSKETKTPSGVLLPDPVLLFTGTNGNVQEISTKGIKWSFTFSNDNYTAQVVINSGADLITSQGVNQDKINEFFKTSNRSVSDAFLAKLEQAKAGLVKEDELANSVNLTIKGVSPGVADILANGKKIGNISVKEDEKNKWVYNYRVSELNDIFIASMIAQATTGPSFYETKTYDDKILPVFSEKGLSFLIDKDDNAKRMVRKLYYEGYTLGDMKGFFAEKKKAEEEAIRAKKEAIMAASVIIYNKQGSVIEKNGKKTEGLITLSDNRVIVKTGKEEDFHIEYDKNYKMVVVKNELAFSADDGVKVVVDDVQYLGVSGSFFGHESSFCKIVYGKDGNMVLKDDKRGYVVLKLANQKKPISFDSATLLGTKKPEKMQKEFDDYVNCPALNYSDYKTDTVDGLIQLVNNYVEKCK